MDRKPSLKAAISEWIHALEDTRVLVGERAVLDYSDCTTAVSRRIPAALRPRTVHELVSIVNIARRNAVVLYPLSTGRNWGYGTANPVVDDCVVVDLSLMDRILDMDPDLGIVTVEPGVTQLKLANYLNAQRHPFLVPTHGGGPTCSLIGNALERGYGITPFADHFGAVTALEAVLPNGEIYRTPLSELGGVTVDKALKWGVGPYLDGLFSQGNFGIVTAMTIALAPAPERVEAFFFSVESDAQLEESILAIQGVLRSIGGITGSINLMNARRVLAMMEPYPADQVSAAGILADSVVRNMSRRNRIMAWTGAGALYGTRKVVGAARSVIRARLRSIAKRLVFISPERLRFGKNVLGVLPGKGGRRAQRLIDTLDKTLRIMSGDPSEIALPLAYWKSGTRPTGNAMMNPAKDGCGLIWYSPLVPMKADRVRVYVDMAADICASHGIEPLITLTSLSDRCFDSTVPLLFDKRNPEETERAQTCYRALFEAGRQEGFLPYRANVDSMPLFMSADSSYWRMAAMFKHAIDPDNILAPGRYSLPR